MLEVIACSLEDAIAAEKGGAGRLEVIVNYEAGGLTPPVELVRDIINSVKIPIRAMIRDDEDFFVPNQKDQKKIERLCMAARSFADMRVDGLVLGFLREGQGGAKIDHELVAKILAGAPGLKATFHRAFELLPDPLSAIKELKRHAQIDRILTGIGDDPWPAKAERLANWERAARPEIGILPGGGLDEEAIRSLIKYTKFKELHVGRVVRDGNRIDGPVLAEKVRKFVLSA